MKKQVLAAATLGLLCAAATAQTSVSQKPLPRKPQPTITPPSGGWYGGGDDCTAPTAIAGQATFNYDNSAATTGVEGQIESNCDAFGTTGIDNDVWFEWTADADGNAVIETCGSADDTKIAAYPAGGCPADGSSIACNDDFCGLQSSISFPVTSGTTYLLQVGNFPGAAGGFGSLTTTIIDPPSFTITANDCATPDAIAGNNLTGAYDNNAATTGVEGQVEALCDAFSTTAVNNDVWAEWTPASSGLATVTTCGTGFDTKIAAYPAGGCPADGSAIACNDDDCGLQSTIMFDVTGGQTYLLQLGTFSDAAFGVANLEITVDAVEPGTNYCTASANSVSAMGSMMSATGSNSLSAGDLVLNASNAPSQPALFYFGPNQISIPFGNGFRCVGGTVVRMDVLGGSGGNFNYAIDFGAFGADLASIGNVNFQCWYRDPSGGGSSFNLSDGYNVVFTP